MPRADPARSPYCASRHLLRNLDDARALRRNPLAQSYFEAAAAAPRGDPAAERRALEQLRGAVHATLARCGEHATARGHVGLGRMHAALLRCELDHAAPAVVAAELGLSERQLRRERRGAHEAFLRAFPRVPQEASTTSVVDVGALRLTQAVELHECGQSALASTACEAVAAGAPRPELRVEALCLAAEVDLDAACYAATSERIAEATAVVALHRAEFADPAQTAALEQIDFVDWSLRRHTGAAGGFAMPPPLVVARAGAAREPDESRRALLVRALAAYALQRWEVGDVEHGLDAVRRANAVLGSLNPARTKERLAVAYAGAMLCALRRPPPAGRERFAAVEQSAERSGHVRTLLRARAERIVSGVLPTRRMDGTLDAVLGMYGAAERRSMSLSFATTAALVAQHERDPERGLRVTELTERIVPSRSPAALLARARRVTFAAELGRYDEAYALACALRADAQELGNPRVHGAVAHALAGVALAQRRPIDAQRHVREALPLLERNGAYTALRHANAIARRLRLN